MLVPEQPDNIQTRLRWSLRVLNCHGQTTTNPGPVHWQQRRAQRVLRCCRNFPGWSVGYNWGHAPARHSKPPLWQRSSRFPAPLPLPLDLSRHVLHRSQYGTVAHRWSDENHHRPRSVLSVQWRSRLPQIQPKTDTNKTENQNHCAAKGKAIARFLSFALYRMFCHDDFPAVL